MRAAGSKMRRISPARRLAFSVLAGVEEGGYASDLLRDGSAGLDARDAGLAGQIVFGVLRFQGQLDYLIYLYSGRVADRLHQAVRLILRCALFQLRWLDRVPARAAVHEAVEITKEHRRAASGLVNAVLRKVNRVPVDWPDRETELSCPLWLLERWEAHFGREAAEGIAQAALKEPLSYIRVPAGEAPPAGVTLEATDVEGAFRVTGSGGTAGLRLHDISSQAIVPLLELREGQSYLDLCAAPGNKTRQALEARPAFAVACDVSYSRLRSVGQVCPRVVLDGTETLPFPPASFDRVFIDAPCSGTGTIRRNPEIKWRVRSEDFGRHAERQHHLLARALTVLKPDGIVLYATCSLEAEENEEVVARVCREGAAALVGEALWRLPGREEGDGFYAVALRRT